MGDDNQATCTRAGCGKTFDPSDSTSVANCVYHPGGPVFHEGNKSWSCCSSTNRPVLSFDEFLAISGCTTGSHSTEKAAAPAPVLSDAQAKAKEATSEPVPTKPVAKLEAKQPTLAIPPRPKRASSSENTTSSNTPFPMKEIEQDPAESTPTPGTQCKRLACTTEYVDGLERTQEECTFHPGQPIFHEGSKGYSCCKPRVLDFNDFLGLKGCKRDKHLFVGQPKDEENVKIRVDHYQTPTQVHVSLFGKGADKAASIITFDYWELHYDLHLPKGKAKQTIPLYGPIDPSKSTFKIMSTKAELVLIKADGRSWSQLEMDESNGAFNQITFGVGGKTGTVGSKEKVETHGLHRD